MSRGRRGNEMTHNMLGMLGMPGPPGADAAGIEDDADLNAELEALLSGKPMPAPRRRGQAGAAAGPRAANADMSLEAQVAMAMRDVPDDEDAGDLEDDPELLAELHGMLEEGEEEEPQEEAPGCSAGLVAERLEQYQLAAAMAESSGDSTKARRYKRGATTLQELLNKARSGQRVAEADLPPPVPTKPSPTHRPAQEAFPPPSRPTPASASDPAAAPVWEKAPAPAPAAARPSPEAPAAKAARGEDSRERAMLIERRDQYKVAALTAKRAGDLAEAKRLVQVAKQFDRVIAAVDEGRTVDLSDLPPPPGPVQAPAPASAPAPAQAAERQGAAPAGLSLEEDLRARMEVMVKTQQKAQEEGNASKARRMGRVVDSYKQAIAACRAGRSYDYSELALPPGFEPLKPPASGGSTPTQPAAPRAPAAPAPAPAPAPAQPAAPGKSLLEDLQARMAAMQAAQQKAQQEENGTKARRLGRVVDSYKQAIFACRKGNPFTYSELALPPGFQPLPDVPAAGGGGGAAVAAGGGGGGGGGHPAPGKLQRTLSRSTNQTLVFLQERQRLFKEAALKAKNEGKKDLALNYLRQSKGFEPMIAAAENGLPVDMSKLPPLPGEKEVDFEFLRAEECDSPDDLDTTDPKALYKQLAQKLQAQVQLCRANSTRCSRMGDVATASKFDRLLRTSQMDLAALRSAETHGDAVPRFHFEWKTFTMERTNPDLADDALELQLVRGIDLALPSGYSADQLDTYLRAELPFPSSEEPQTFSTDVVRHSNSPEFQAVHKFNINRKQRTFQRLVKSRAVKVEVWYKRGFLKGDKVLGVATVKLAELESQCDVHGSFDLMDGRKAIGGRVEVRVRLREPISGRQVEETREKWLVIDAGTGAAAASRDVPRTSGERSSEVESVEVMRYERDLLVQKMKNLRQQLTPTMADTLDGKRRELEAKITALEKRLKEGGAAGLRAYVASILKLSPKYNAEARERLKEGDRDKASVLMTKKKLVEKEAAAIRARLSAK